MFKNWLGGSQTSFWNSTDAVLTATNRHRKSTMAKIASTGAYNATWIISNPRVSFQRC
jgi:hypothetical protein